MNPNNNDRIDVNNDPILTGLHSRWLTSETEEASFFFPSPTSTTEKTLDEITKDKVQILQEINAHLKKSYKENTVADRWISNNELYISRNK